MAGSGFGEINKNEENGEEDVSYSQGIRKGCKKMRREEEHTVEQPLRLGVALPGGGAWGTEKLVAILGISLVGLALEASLAQGLLAGGSMEDTLLYGSSYGGPVRRGAHRHTENTHNRFSTTMSSQTLEKNALSPIQ